MMDVVLTPAIIMIKLDLDVQYIFGDRYFIWNIPDYFVF
jgi:hypothetical protein